MPTWLKYGLIASVILVILVRGGAAAMMPLMRFAVPVLLVYGAYRWTRSLLASGSQTESLRQSSSQPIQICPKCGKEVGSCKDCPSKKPS